MARKWEYTRGQMVLTMQEYSDGSGWKVITLVARASKYRDTTRKGESGEYFWVWKTRMHWGRPHWHRTKREVYSRFQFRSEEEAEADAIAQAARLGIVYVPGIEEGDEIYTIQDSVLMGLRNLA